MRSFLIQTLLLASLLAPAAPARPQRGARPAPPKSGPANPERRVALVIGNSAYEVAPLRNPVNDARDMAETLTALGFEVSRGENLGQQEMKRAIREFGDKIRGGGVGLFFYAGHALEVDGVNYLIPVGAKWATAEEVEYETVPAGLVLAQMQSAGDALKIMILDACRDNPFPRDVRSGSRGLARMNAPRGTLIAYSTAPGKVADDGDGRNGIYTRELLKFLRVPNLKVEEVFKLVRVSVLRLTGARQEPWEHSSLTGDFYFSGAGQGKPTGLPLSAPPVDPAAVELAYWNSIKDSRDPEDFKAYLEKYPDGQFVAIARRRALVFGDPAARTDHPARLPASEQQLTISSVNCLCMQLVTLKVPSSLIIAGRGWDGSTELKVSVNGRDVSHLIDTQKEYTVTLDGTIQELNLRNGKNEVTVTVNGVTSAPYVFRQAIK